MTKRRTLLVVEDDRDLREFFRMALTQAGFEVRVAVDGWQALLRLDAQTPDVVVLDLVLPGLNGEAVLAELSSHPLTRNIPVVVVTGTTQTPTVANVACVLRKPVTADQLIAVVQRCLSTGSPSTHPATRRPDDALTRECLACGDHMRLAHAGEATVLYICPCCGASTRQPPVSASLPIPSVPAEKR